MELNPGHLDTLQKLGILAADETVIDAAVLAERVINSPQMAEALDTIRQEAINIGMSFDVVSQTIDDIAEILPDLDTREAILQELAGLREEIQQLPHMVAQLAEIQVFTETLVIFAKEQKISFSSKAVEQLSAIQGMMRQAGEMRGIAQLQLAKGQQVIWQLVDKLGEM